LVSVHCGGAGARRAARRQRSAGAGSARLRAGPALGRAVPDAATLVRAALAAGETATARAAEQASIGEVGTSDTQSRQAAAEQCRGLLAADADLLRTAADRYAAVGRPLEAGLAFEDAAVAYAQRGDTDAARTALDGALGLYAGLGAAWDARRAASRLRRHGIRQGARGTRRGRPSTGWQALTPTQTRVARLVAAGRSNPDIANELFLSRHTVETHVSHILAKLGATSRKEVALLCRDSAATG